MVNRDGIDHHEDDAAGLFLGIYRYSLRIKSSAQQRGEVCKLNCPAMGQKKLFANKCVNIAVSREFSGAPTHSGIKYYYAKRDAATVT
jgi:hypothetical protein